MPLYFRALTFNTFFFKQNQIATNVIKTIYMYTQLLQRTAI